MQNFSAEVEPHCGMYHNLSSMYSDVAHQRAVLQVLPGRCGLRAPAVPAPCPPAPDGMMLGAKSSPLPPKSFMLVTDGEVALAGAVWFERDFQTGLSKWTTLPNFCQGEPSATSALHEGNGVTRACLLGLMRESISSRKSSCAVLGAQLAAADQAIPVTCA